MGTVYKDKGELEIKLIGVTDLLNKRYAYWERLKVPEVANQVLRVFFRNKKVTKQTIFAQKEVNREDKSTGRI